MSENIDKIIRVGSRKSELALIQTKHVISRLQKLYPEKKFEIHTMTTIGDRVLNVSLPKIGEKSLFTRDLEDALRNGGVDFVVHSLKDLPTALPAGMAIGAVLEREDSRDALVVNEKYKGKTIATLPAGCVIGTSSLRRTAQLRRQYPHLEVCDIRGNLNTRLAKLDAPNSKYSGIILAQAGLLRMGWMNRISQVLDPTDLLYAVGQGALAVECRSNDFEILEMLQKLMCLKTTCRILAERSFLKTLGGGCSAPVAVWTKLNGTVENNNKDELLLDITGAVWSLDGKIEIREANDCCLNLKRKILIEEKEKDEEDEDVSPRKRVKDHDRGDVGGNKKQTSPKVVDDDQFPINLSAGDSKNLVPDIQHLIDIHGELFKKCPFYALHQKDQENGNSSTTKDECPLKIPVGQDFMGKCPYVDTEQKIDLSEQFGGKCPVTGKLLTDVERSHDNHKTNKDETDNSATKVPSKCPFSSAGVAQKSSNNNNESKAENIGDSRRLSHESCPFLQKNIKLIDYEAANKDQQNNKMPELIDDSDELFCGLYRHKCYNLDIFAKCEDLGKKLAENLIQKGALDVMKCAQQEIREKI